MQSIKNKQEQLYRWHTTGPSKRILESMYADLISEIHKQSRYTYGSPRITEELKRKGYCISRRRVANIMRKNGWRSCRKRRFRVTTDWLRRIFDFEPSLSCQQKSGGTWFSNLQTKWSMGIWHHLYPDRTGLAVFDNDFGFVWLVIKWILTYPADDTTRLEDGN